MQDQQLPQRSRARAVAATVFVMLAVVALVGTAPQLQATALKFFKGSGFPDDVYLCDSPPSFLRIMLPVYSFAHVSRRLPPPTRHRLQVLWLRSQPLFHQHEPGVLLPIS